MVDRSGAIGGVAHPATPALGSNNHDVEIFRTYWPHTGFVDSSLAERFLARTLPIPRDKRTQNEIPFRRS